MACISLLLLDMGYKNACHIAKLVCCWKITVRNSASFCFVNIMFYIEDLLKCLAFQFHATSLHFFSTFYIPCIFSWLDRLIYNTPTNLQFRHDTVIIIIVSSPHVFWHCTQIADQLVTDSNPPITHMIEHTFIHRNVYQENFAYNRSPYQVISRLSVHIGDN